MIFSYKSFSLSICQIPTSQATSNPNNNTKFILSTIGGRLTDRAVHIPIRVVINSSQGGIKMTDKQPMEDIIDESKHDNSSGSGADLTMISPELTESRPTDETPRVSAISRSVVERKKLVMSSENEEEEVLSKLSDSDDDILHGSPEPKTWLNLLDDLSDKLDPFSKREASKIIDEIIRLETYLNDENNLIEQENRNLKFSNQKEIIHYLNKALRVRESVF